MSPGLRKIALPLVLVSGSLLVGVVLAEVALRVIVSVSDKGIARLKDFDPLNVQVEPFGTLGYRQRPYGKFKYFNGTVANADSLGYRGPEITVAKPPGVLRVVLLGGSTTHGWGVNDGETIDAHMRRLLAGRSEPSIEVINAAFDGYDARQILERVQHDLLRLSPDLIIVNSGINDVRNARFPNLKEDDPRTLIWGGEMDRLRHEKTHGPSLENRIKHHFLLPRLPGFVINQTKSYANRDTVAQGYPEAAHFFEENLRRIAALAAKHNIKLIFSIAPSSLRTKYRPDAPAEKAYWLKDAATTAVYRDTLAARMERVANELTSKGQRIPFLRAELPKELFIDDAHLTSEGNAAVAALFVEATVRQLRP